MILRITSISTNPLVILLLLLLVLLLLVSVDGDGDGDDTIVYSFAVDVCIYYYIN